MASSLALRDYVPFIQAPKSNAKRAKVVSDSDSSSLAKLFKIASLALGLSTTLGTRTNFESAPYDLNRISQAVDTDSFVRQAFNKYKELFWKEGWELVGENPEAVDYLYERLDYMEFAMKQPIQSFLVDVGDQLIKYGNCFLAKSRGDLNPLFPVNLTPAGNKDPIIGYYIIPAETVEIHRNKHNKVLGYRQRIDHLVDGFQNRRAPRWKPDEVIHLALDKKPGRAFGTPFMVAVLDDVVALRQMEEDIQNLVHKELFPLYKYKVGTEDHPAEPGEIEHAAQELENLRTDGGLVLPDRHDVEVVGAEDSALDATGYLQHFLTRVCTGLGLSPHHLGIMNEGGNRSVTDRLDIALYDKIKSYQRYLGDAIRLFILSELLLEGGFDPITHPMVKGVSDRCDFRFNEIDVDTQVKKETHIIQKYAANIITLPETRHELGYELDVEEAELQASVMSRAQPIQTKTVDGAMKTEVPQKPDAQQPSKGGAANKPNTTRGVGNKVRPSNQHGRRTSPNIRHGIDDNWLQEMVSLINDTNEEEL